MRHLDRYVIARDRNVVRVDFRREPDPPAPKFPGAGALRSNLSQSACCCEGLRSNLGRPRLSAAFKR